MNVGTVLKMAREKVPFYQASWCPVGLQRQMLSDLQRSLYRQALNLDAYYRYQVAHILVAPSAANDVGRKGAGTGQFGIADQAVNLEGGTGLAQGFDFASATMVISRRPVVGATLQSVTVAGTAWTTNQWQGRILRVEAGAGAPQIREVLSNTADTLVISTGDTDFATALDVSAETPSLIAVYDAPLTALADVGVMLTYPTTEQRIGFITKLDATGTPYLDLTEPVYATVNVPISLPPVQDILQARVHGTQPGYTAPIRIVGAGYLDVPTNSIALVRQGDRLIPIGPAEYWAQVRSIEIRYQPVLPDLARDADLLFLGGMALNALQDGLAKEIALRGIMVNAASAQLAPIFRDGASQSLNEFLATILRTGTVQALPEVQVY